MTSTQTALKISDLTFSFGEHRVLSNIDIEIKKGELIYLFGANGSGKSTFVKIILGLIKQDKGKIEIFGQPRTQSNVSKYISYVPQYSAIERDFPISVKELIELECHNVSSCKVGAWGHLDFLGISHLAERSISALSGGEFQKVLIARALTSDPEILILDEPGNNLDEKSQNELMDFIDKLNHETLKTIVIISHDQGVIAEKGQHRIAFLIEHNIKILNNKSEISSLNYSHH